VSCCINLDLSTSSLFELVVLAVLLLQNDVMYFADVHNGSSFAYRRFLLLMVVSLVNVVQLSLMHIFLSAPFSRLLKLAIITTSKNALGKLLRLDVS